MPEVIKIHQWSYFRLPEAQALVPILNRWAKEAQQVVEPLLLQLEVRKDAPREEIESIEIKIDKALLDWQEKVRKVGVHARGLWSVDFEGQEQIWTWKFPEQNVRYVRAKGLPFEQHAIIIEANKTCSPSHLG